jgi:molybdate transport system substrate-binding protein
MRTLARAAAAAAGLALLATGCGGGADGSAETITLRVFAAASLQEPFEELGEEFETQHDGVEVELDLAGSSTLVEQIRQGAPADVFASANPETMDTLVEAGLHGADPVDFTSNTLRIAVPAGNPAGVTDLASLTEEGLNLVVCAPEVPCGAAAETVERAAGLEFAPVSEEQSVTDVLSKVTSGEADAGLVYATDVRRAGDQVEGVDVPEAQEAVNVYPITTVEGAENAALGQDFVDLVTGVAGQEILAGYGFVGP